MQAPLRAKNDADATQTDGAATAAPKRGLTDKRPEAVAQRRLAGLINDSQRGLRQRALSDTMDNSPRVAQLKARQQIMDSSPAAVLQRKTVDVAGGQFKDDLIGDGYKAIHEDESDVRGTYVKVGAQMELAFVPHPSLPAGEVSLVQTTRSTVRNETNPHVPDQLESLLDQRRTAQGSAIDQQIYLTRPQSEQHWESNALRQQFADMAGLGALAGTNALLTELQEYFTTGAGAGGGVVPRFGARNPTSIKTKLTAALDAEEHNGQLEPGLRLGVAEVFRLLAAQTKLVNLDPRYAEERSSADAPLKPVRQPGNLAGSGGWTAVRENGAWQSNAALRDQPGHKIAPTDVLTGGEYFETAAMADGNEFLGSVAWGFEIINGRAVLDPPEIALVDYGAASNEFFAAAAAWNAMTVRDPVSGGALTPLQLPSRASISSLKASRRMAQWFIALEKRYPNAQWHTDSLSLGDIGEFLLTGKIAAWDGEDTDDAPLENQPVLMRTLRDMQETYPQGEQYLSTLTHEQFGEYLMTGEIAAWEALG